MPRGKATDTLARLGTGELAQVLAELLERHPDLRGEANAISGTLIVDVCFENVAEEVADLTTSIDDEDFSNRAGAHSWGYIESSEAAWELLDESIEDVRADVKRRFEAGMKPAAEKICHGIVLGLHSVKDKNDDGVLAWASDFPAEAATWSLSLLLELYPQRQRRAAGNRIVRAIVKHADDWVEMLSPVVEEATSAKPGGKE